MGQARARWTTKAQASAAAASRTGASARRIRCMASSLPACGRTGLRQTLNQRGACAHLDTGFGGKVSPAGSRMKGARSSARLRDDAPVAPGLEAQGVAELFERVGGVARVGRAQGVDARLVRAGRERGELEAVAAVLVYGA